MLVVESNVGKSCLAMRLAEDRYPNDAELGTTHGMRFWRVEPQRLDPSAVAPEGESRDLVLWDMGVQDEYRFVHQLFLPNTALAMVFLDPRRGRTALEEAEAWNMRLEKQLRGRSAAKLLVEAKIDEPSGAINHAAIDHLIERCGFTGYYETSARTGRGIAELKEAIARFLDWDSLTTASSTELFQIVRREILNRQRRDEVILPLHVLEASVQEQSPDKYDAAAVKKVAEQLAAQGLIAITRRASGEHILILRVEEVERYAGSLIVAARNNPHGVPALEEVALGLPSQRLPGIELDERLPRDQEVIVLECVVELLIQHGICFPHGRLLIFPALFSDLRTDEDTALPHSVSMYYDFTGDIDNVYASLVAQLAVSEEFGSYRLWANRVEFDEPGQGICGIRRVNRTGGLAHIDLYFAEETSQDRRNFFIKVIEEHLVDEGVTVAEHQAIKCKECDEIISEETVQKRLARGNTDVLCPVCETPTALKEIVKTKREQVQESDLDIIALRKDLYRTKVRTEKTGRLRL